MRNKAAPNARLQRTRRLTGSLFELGGNGREYVVQRRTDRLRRGDDYDRDARGDKAVLDRGGARLVLQECENPQHVVTPCRRTLQHIRPRAINK